MGIEGHIEVALGEAERAEFFRHGLGEFGNQFLALGGKLLAGALQLAVELLQRRIEARQFRIALFERLKFQLRLRAERDHVAERRAVFAFEALQQVQPLLQFAQARGIEVHGVGVAGKLCLQFTPRFHSLLVRGEQRLRAHVHALEIVQHAPERAGLGENGVVVLAQKTEGALREFEQAGGVARPLMFRLHLLVLAGLKFRAFDFADLEAEEVELLRVSFFIHDERGLLRYHARALADERGKLLALWLQFSECIENRELLRGLEQGLMLVRPVHVHEPFAQRGQRGQRGRRAVHELFICPRRREHALDDQLVFLARLQAVLVEKALEFTLQRGPAS